MRPKSDKVQKKLADDARLLRWWRQFHRDEKNAVLTGPHARTLIELFRMFASLQCVKPAQLIGFVGTINWSKIDSQTRLTVLHELNAAITKYREKRGLPPIDDPLPGAAPSAYQVVYKTINEFPAPAQERPAHRGPDPDADHET